jgi:tRNA threonylcarbamoyl adenosine modification protein (Sua5/YciO/YrdC/YwlC family)
LNDEITRAVERIRSGGVVGLPTDTVYGLGVDPNNEDAVALLYELKGRPQGRPIGILAASIEQASSIGEISGPTAELARRHWPGALTLVVRPRMVLADWVGDHQANTIGLRVPGHPIALALLERAGPLAVTSANLSGGPETFDADEARAIFGDEVVYLTGISPGGKASTVVDVTGPRPVVIRQGPVVIGEN